MFIYISPRAFFARFPAPCGFHFYRSRRVSCGVRALFFSCGCRFHPFSRVRVLTYSVRFSSLFSPLVPFAPVFDVSRSFPSLISFVFVRPSLAVGLCVIAHRPVPVLSPVSLFRCGWAGRRRSFRVVGACPVAWRCWSGGVVLPFRLAVRFLTPSSWGRGVLGWFFRMEL